MNDKKLALDLMAIAAFMLLDKPVKNATVVVDDAPFMHPHNCTCFQCASHKAEAPRKPQHDFTREPDGVQINVDRPRMENYTSRQKFAMDMANYRTLIDQAKKCEWESRIPSNIPAEVHANRRDWYEDNEPMHPSQFAPRGWGW